MSLLNRISSGLILADDFSSPKLNASLWQASPTDSSRYSLTERSGFLRLKHGSPDLFILTDTPRTDFVFEIDTDYEPIRPSDSGGIVAFQDINNYIEMVEYYDAVTGTTKAFDRLRMVKRSDLYEGYGSNDNGKTWEIIGASYMVAPKIGMVLHGINESSSDTLDVTSCRIYKSTFVQVGNLKEGQTIKLFNEAGAVIQQQTCDALSDFVNIDVSSQTLPLKGSIKLYDSSGFLLEDSGVVDEIWGGDVFWYGLQVDLEIDGVILKQDREYQLGDMHLGVIEKMAYLVNNNYVPINNVFASVQQFSIYTGWEWADISLNSFGEPLLYRDEIEIGTIRPGERIPIWIKVTKRSTVQIASLHDYKFRIMVESR